MWPECRVNTRRYSGLGLRAETRLCALEGDAGRGLTWGEARAAEEDPGRTEPQDEQTHTQERGERKQHCHASTRTSIILGTSGEAPLPAGGKGGADPRPHPSPLTHPAHGTPANLPPLTPCPAYWVSGPGEKEPVRQCENQPPVGERLTPHCHRSGDG